MRAISKLLRIAALGTGGLCFVLILLCFTPLPSAVYNWMGTDPGRLPSEPDYIVVLGGGGIPSESGLMRTYYAAQEAHQYPDANLVVAMPDDGHSPEKMEAEIVMRGIAADRILFEESGRNTREQALNTAKLIDADPRTALVLIVTSPEHLKRALMTFRKAGFGHVAGTAAFSTEVESDLAYDGRALGGPDLPISDAGKNLTLRYEFWDHLGKEISLIREFCALAYYRMMGWI